MKLLLIALLLFFTSTACASDSTKVKRVKDRKEIRVVDSLKNGKKIKEVDLAKAKERKSKKRDSVKVVVPPPAPQTPLFSDILPQPLSLCKGEGRFTINEETSIICDKGFEKAADYLRIYIPIEKTKGGNNNSIKLIFDKEMGKEEYSLTVNKKGVAICANDYGGIFNGIQSLLQLLPHRVYNKGTYLPIEISYIEVKDAPQHHYRGLLLDVARTYQPVHEIKRVIDYMAYFKLNKLHFHLVDNEGWRVEIKKYPNFAKEGGFRGGDAKLHPIYGRFNQKYGGYYTQEELRDIVAYAAERNIEVIPEIDMPGHSKALGCIHPSILCNYTPNTASTNGIDTRDVWCVAKEENYALIEDIVKELVDIFPSEYLHIGGDEVSFSQWKQCPDCQQLMQKMGLKDGAQLEQHFLNRVSKILAKYSRKAVVWDEAVDGGMLPTSTMVTGWRGVKQCLETTAKGYPTIIMPSEVFYLDKRQSPHERGHLSSKGVSLKTLCDFSFANAGFGEEQRKNIAGVEAAFWSEIYLANINTRNRHFSDYIEYMLFPRLFAVAEVAWSKERRSYDDMQALLSSNFYHKLHAMSASFRIEPPAIKVENGKIFASADNGAKIYYKDIRTNKTEEYKTPLNADMAPFIAFHTRLMTGYSNEVGTPAYYTSQKPKCNITSSMPFSQKRTAELCATYRGAAYTTRAAKEGDWVEFRFEKPVKCSYLKVATGFEHLHRSLFAKGHIEVCYDGEKFVNAGNLYNGYYILRPKRKAIHALRIVADGVSDAESKVIIQPLEIK